MAVLFDKSLSQGLFINEALVQVEPITFAAWFYSDNLTDHQALVSIAKETTDTDHYELFLAGAWTGDPAVAYVREPGFVDAHAKWAESTIGYSTGSWQHVMGVFAAANSRAILLDGGSKGVESTSLNPQVLTKTSIGYLCRNSATHYMSGKIAIVAIWNIALSDAEGLQLAQGALPNVIQASNLVAYWPLVSNGEDVSGNGKHLTGLNSPTFDGDTPIILTPAIPSRYNAFNLNLDLNRD